MMSISGTVSRWARSHRAVLALSLAALLVGACGAVDSEPAEGDLGEPDAEADGESILEDGEPPTPRPPRIIEVYRNGDGVYPRYRIPSLLHTQAGTLLAFMEGRQAIDDQSENDIVLRRSTDRGETWGAVQVIDEDGANSLNDPTAVQVVTGPHQGRVLLMYQKIPLGGAEPGYGGDRHNAIYLTHSDDDGQTWSPPEDLSPTLRPEGLYNVTVGPGIAIQKRHEPHAGRIVYPARQSPPIQILSFFSDDGGDTWQRGAPADDSAIPGTVNENQVAELSDGSLLVNARSRDGNKLRQIGRSTDGGQTWTPLVEDPALLEPECMAGLLLFADSTDEDRERLLYSGPYSQVNRLDGSVLMSYDGGRTWPIVKPLFEEFNVFSYSVMARLDCRTVAVLFEAGINTPFNNLAIVDLPWLTDGEDWGACRGR